MRSQSFVRLSSISPECKFVGLQTQTCRFHDTNFFRSQLDTTAVQALIDTRNEVERWTDAPVEVRATIYFVAPRYSLNVI